MGGGGDVFRRSKNAPKRHYQLQLRLTKAKAQGQTSIPSPSPPPLDKPARPAALIQVRVRACLHAYTAARTFSQRHTF